MKPNEVLKPDEIIMLTPDGKPQRWSIKDNALSIVVEGDYTTVTTKQGEFLYHKIPWCIMTKTSLKKVKKQAC